MPKHTQPALSADAEPILPEQVTVVGAAREGP
jgi:hypothetical protein